MPPPDKVDLQTQVHELTKSMGQMKEFMERMERNLLSPGSGPGEKGERDNSVPCLDSSSTLSISTSSSMTTVSDHQRETEPSEPLKTPLQESVKGGSSTSAETQKKTSPTDEVWTQGMQKIIASIEKPKTALPTFTGDSRKEYALLMQRFHRYLRDHAVDASSKLDMLIDSFTGRTNDSLMRYVRQGPEEGYNEALKMLASRLGDTEDHIDELVMDLISGPAIPDNDLQQI